MDRNAFSTGAADRVKASGHGWECWGNYSPRIWGSRDAARKQIREANAGLRAHWMQPMGPRDIA